MKSSKSIAAAHRVASTLAHLVRLSLIIRQILFSNRSKTSRLVQKNSFRSKTNSYGSRGKRNSAMSNASKLASLENKDKIRSDLANLGDHQMCAILADEDNLAQNSNFDQQMANKLKRALGRLTFLLPYDAARIYKSQIGGSFVERKRRWFSRIH